MTPAPYPSPLVRYAVGGLIDTAVAMVDSGCEGHLAVPESLRASLPTPTYVDRVRTASGEIVHVPVYRGRAELVDMPRIVDALVIALGDEFLIGIAVMNHFRVIFDHGLRVIVEP